MVERGMDNKSGEWMVPQAGLFSSSAGRTLSSELRAQAGRQGPGKGSLGFCRQ